MHNQHPAYATNGNRTRRSTAVKLCLPTQRQICTQSKIVSALSMPPSPAVHLLPRKFSHTAKERGLGFQARLGHLLLSSLLLYDINVLCRCIPTFDDCSREHERLVRQLNYRYLPQKPGALAYIAGEKNSSICFACHVSCCGGGVAVNP